MVSNISIFYKVKENFEYFKSIAYNGIGNARFYI